MNAQIAVMQMLHVLMTQLIASFVHVMMGILEMELLVQVNLAIFGIQTRLQG